MKMMFFSLLLTGCVLFSSRVWAAVKTDTVKIGYEITEGDDGAVFERQVQGLEVLDSGTAIVQQKKDTTATSDTVVIKKEMV